ncbi:putative transposase [Mycobacterium xenopi 4042]|uniref:Putative transposase n=1 Tax=Mycobacterium xenopi 4042 TaxID=1299334 RepID=X8DK56_MYCXE|nr:putative transposase [Mycobacterium xenopi 4042]
MSLFDSQDLAEIAHPDYPGERLIACRNPALAHERARKRDDLLAATEIHLARIRDRVAAAPWRAPTRSLRPTARSLESTRWASTLSARSPTPPSRSNQTRPLSRPKPPRWHLRATHQCRRRHPRFGRDRRGLQEAGQRRTRLSHPQDRRPGPAAHPPLA